VISEEELSLYNEWAEVQKAFVKAKEKAAKDPAYRDSEEYQAAKQKMSTMRTYWRQVGEATGTRTPIAPLSTKAAP
jgi:hypothetical protein